MSPPTPPAAPADARCIAWPAPLLEARFLRRYHRFLSDFELPDGRVVVGHCINTGTMEGLVAPGARAWLLPNDDPARKLRYTWEIVEIDGVRIGVDTSLPNRAVRQLLEARLIPGLTDFDTLRAEPRYKSGSGRADFALDRAGAPTRYVEVKNCHLVYPDALGYFPDSVSERATKHLHELAERVAAGERATVLFTVQRVDGRGVRPSDVHDPAFAAAAREAARAGVEFRALRFDPRPDGLHFLDLIPVDLAPYDVAAPRAWRESLRATSGWQRPPAQPRSTDDAPAARRKPVQEGTGKPARGGLRQPGAAPRGAGSPRAKPSKGNPNS